MPEAAIHIEAVHRLSDLGAVVTHVVCATSREGLEAEWREISVLAFDGDRISRCEVFAETDLDEALVRFDDPQPYDELTARHFHSGPDTA